MNPVQNILYVKIGSLKESSMTTIEVLDLTGRILKQEKTYKRLQNFLENYSKEIDAGLQLVSQSMELIATVFDSNATRHQEEIDRLMVEYNEMNRIEEERQERMLGYEEELRDANGDRYEELLVLIDEEKKAKDRNYIDERAQKNKLAELEHKKLLDERKAAQWRKAQNIIEAVIQGALAVVEALPNVILAAVVGGLSAVSVATIAAQKIPDVPPQETYKKGGFTGVGKEDEPAGVVHRGEYIVPAKVVNSQSAQIHLDALEKQRVRGYQDGGYVIPNASTYSSEFNYDRLIYGLADAVSKLPNPQVGLVNISEGIKEVELTKQNASLTR
jgi:hypothetical protein